jgi:hypothetical protein
VEVGKFAKVACTAAKVVCTEVKVFCEVKPLRVEGWAAEGVSGVENLLLEKVGGEQWVMMIVVVVVEKASWGMAHARSAASQTQS